MKHSFILVFTLEDVKTYNYCHLEDQEPSTVQQMFNPCDSPSQCFEGEGVMSLVKLNHVA